MSPATPDATFGGWSLLRELGRGGMGVVYRAVHADGTIGALKTVSVADPRFVDATHREIRMLMRVVHPGIVRILDSGVEQGQPWYVMELLEGRSLAGPGVVSTGMRTWSGDGAHESPVGRSGPLRPDALDVALSLCTPLGALHAAGLVHRDLKPDNLLVRPDGSLVIADFGLSVSSGGRDDLADGPRSAGTTAYMSPEQIRGEPVDARADLYALGCMLYELLTGSPPFLGPPDWVRTAHLTDRPVPPGALVDVPPGVDALVARLLAKSPRDRFSHAADVARALLDVGARGAFEAPAQPALLRAAVTGRDDVLALLSAESTGRIVLLGGAPGSGKTRLARHLVGESARAGHPVVVGACRRSGSPPGALAQALEAAFALATRRDAFAPVAAGAAPALASLVPAAARLAAPAPSLGGAADRHRQLRAASDLLEGLGRTWVVLEDLQHADEWTLAFLQGLATRPRAFRVLGTFRDDVASVALHRLRATPGVREVRLGPLRDDDLERIAAEQLGLPALGPAESALARACAGNPLLLGEALTAWAGGHRDLVRGTPEDLDRLLDARLEAQGAPALRVLRAVVVLAEHARPDRVALVAGVDAPTAVDALAGLVRARILEETRDGLHVVCEPLGERVLRDTPRDCFRAAAAVLADTGADAAVGRLLVAAGDDAAAAPALLRAAREADDRSLNEIAIALYGEAIARLDGPSAARAEAWRKLGHCNRMAGRMDAARAALATAVGEARGAGDPALLALCVMGLGMTDRTLRPTDAETEFGQAIALARASGSPRVEALALGNLAAMLIDGDERWDEARVLWERALTLFRSLGDHRDALRVEGDLAIVDDVQGRLDEALARYLDVALRQRALGCALDEAMTMGNLALLHLKRGAHDLALATAEQALAVKRAHGYRRGEAMELMSLAQIHRRAGRQEEALRTGHAALEVFDEVDEAGWVRRMSALLLEWQAGRETPVR